MASITKSRRRQQRHGVARERAAWVKFEYPSPNGREYRLPLTNVSCSGISFRLTDEELGGMEEGTTLSETVLCFGDCMIYGDILVMHVTSDPGGTEICGALFYPKADADLVKLKGVIAGMEVVETD